MLGHTDGSDFIQSGAAMTNHKFFFHAIRRPTRFRQQEIDRIFEDLDLLPPPWRLIDRSIIHQKMEGRIVRDYWTFRGRMGKGVLGFFTNTLDADVLCLEWNNGKLPVPDLIASLPEFVTAFSPRDLILRRGMDWPEIDWNKYSRDTFGWTGPYYGNDATILGIANYWSADLCQTAFGKTPQEVVSALQGVALDLRIIHDGVYAVFAENFGAEDDVLELNRRVRPLLGGYGLCYPPPWYRPER